MDRAVDLPAGGALPFAVTLFCLLVKMRQLRAAAFRADRGLRRPETLEQLHLFLTGVCIHRCFSFITGICSRLLYNRKHQTIEIGQRACDALFHLYELLSSAKKIRGPTNTMSHSR